MRHCSIIRSLTLALAAACLLGLAAPGNAQDKGRIKINSVRIGFPLSSTQSELKSGFWMPVYVDVTAGPERIPRGEVTIEAADADDVRNRYTVPLPTLEPGEQATVQTYTKPGSAGDEIMVTIRIDDRLAAVHQEVYPAMDLDHHLYVTIGPRMPSLRRALSKAAPEVKVDGEEATVVSRDSGPYHIAGLEDIRMLPKHWFGYEGVDLIVMGTADRQFLTSLLNEREGRKEALTEWIRRGGRIIISVGSTQDLLAQIEVLHAMLPVTIKGTTPQPRLRSILRWAPKQTKFENAVPKNTATGTPPPIDVTKLEARPGREIDSLLAEPDGALLVVRGAYGMGRVTLVAFDLDKPPFSNWDETGQKEVWAKLLAETAPPAPANVDRTQMQRRSFGQADDNDLATRLQMNLEDFADVPVISFGWVALFILIYILIVGPLDYFFLKKVVKRLELTWITFPTVVITISVLAYFTAYWLKGNDQRINKIDLLDVDLNTRQVYGTSWFTIFSPRIQNYTVGLESNVGAPSVAADGQPASSVVMSWMSRPETGFGGAGRPRSQSLFRRAYDYEKDATGLRGVPIQVWSTKSFTAAWNASLDAGTPIIEADLKHVAGNVDALTGTITNNLKVPIEDAVLYYGRAGAGKWFPLERLAPSIPKRVDNIQAGGGTELQAWLTAVPTGANATPSPQRRQGQVAYEPTITLMKRLLFQPPDSPNRRNNSLRHLDQYWRLGHKDEVFIFGRIPRNEGEAEPVNGGPEATTRLWLGGLPSRGEPRPPILGTMSQEAYLRILAPVKPAE